MTRYYDDYGDDADARADALADAAAERQAMREDAAEPPPPCANCAHFDAGEAQSWDSPGYPPCCEAVGDVYHCGGAAAQSIDDLVTWCDDDFDDMRNHSTSPDDCPHYERR